MTSADNDIDIVFVKFVDSSDGGRENGGIDLRAAHVKSASHASG
jgi:hypothetical protein